MDKPSGITSFEVVRQVRRALGVKKVGHTGTLDPLATGVLPVCVGEATKIAGLLTAQNKVYYAQATLGICTDSLDSTGRILVQQPVGDISRSVAVELLGRFRGEIEQRPPAYSAIRTNGRRAYELARQGQSPVLEPRRVTVNVLELLTWDPPIFALRVDCSKGTYVRSLIADIGDALGCGAVLTALRRERSGPFTLKQSVALSELSYAAGHFISIDDALEHLPAVEIEQGQLVRLRHGQSVPLRGGLRSNVGLARVRCGHELVALGLVDSSGTVSPRRVFVQVGRQSVADG